MRLPARRRRGRGLSRSAAAAVALLSCGLALAGLAGPAVGASATIGGPELAAPGYLVGPGAPALPPTTATSFVVVDADTGDVLAAHNAHQKLAPASTLKALTAVTLLPELRAKSTVVAASDAPAVDGTKAGIIAGTAYTVNDLFTAMLMMSANDAAVALADANGGLATTLAQMNAEAAYLQADDTVAMTPDGLDAKGQSSSAYDLALIFRAGLKLPAFQHYLSLLSAQFPAPKNTSFQIQTHDELLTQYPGMVGGKNGYTVAAQASYVGAATRNGHTIIVALMRDVPNFWPEAKLLLNWGFAAQAANAGEVGTLVSPLVPVSASPEPTPGAPAVGAAASAAAAAAAAPAVHDPPKSASRSPHSSSGLLPVLGWTAAGLVVVIAAVSGVRIRTRSRRRRQREGNYLKALSRL